MPAGMGTAVQGAGRGKAAGRRTRVRRGSQPGLRPTNGHGGEAGRDCR